MKKIAIRNTPSSIEESAAPLPLQAPADEIGMPAPGEEPGQTQTAGWRRWLTATRRILPIYPAIHLALLTITALSVLFLTPDFQWSSPPLSTLWQAWNRWDVGHYTALATQGYNDYASTAFFPLYPLLIRGMMFLEHSPLVAGMLVSNLAGLVMLVVLYQMVREDFDEPTAERTVLYLSLFPTAFYFLAAYSEALFLCLSLLCFYQIRHGHWWLAGLFGFFASLTRSAGVLLFLPFCFEYLRQRQFNLKALRLNVVAAALIPAGLAAFALYCYLRFGDPLAFSHAEVQWNRAMTVPWRGIARSATAIIHSAGLLSFQAQRNLIDLGADLLFAALILLGFLGPWRFPRRYYSYLLYAALFWVFVNLVPNSSSEWFYPLQSVSRYMLAIFPVFIVLARLGRQRALHLHYVMISGAILFFLATQFLTGHWVI